MQVGFALARALQAWGYCLPRDGDDHAATLLEVFPDAAFVTLLGARPRKETPVGMGQRRALLERAGIRVEASATHDDLDAVAAALTALRWRRGEGCAVGDPDEGMIALPVKRSTLLDQYRPAPLDEDGR
jgi:predicted nuclease with RNAse H fold